MITRPENFFAASRLELAAVVGAEVTQAYVRSCMGHPGGSGT
jgi:hypothetical protein